MTAYYTDVIDNFESSNLEALYWDRLSQVLYVCFLSGSIVGYRSVPETVFTALALADSKGSAYNTYVRGKYHGLGHDVRWDDFVKREEIPGSLLLSAIQSPATKYEVTGIVKVVRKVVAPTMEAACEQFLADNPGASVTEVTVKFV